MFFRSGNEYRLNREGERLLSKIERPFDDIIAAFTPQGSSQKSELTIGVPTSFATAWLIPRMENFRRTHPNIDLRLDTSGSPIKKLGDTLDMIIFFAEEGAEPVEVEVLRPQGAFLVAQEGLVDSRDGLRKTLRSVPLLVHRHLPHILENWLSELGLDGDLNLSIDEFDDGPLLIAAARSGLGLALVLEDMVTFYGDAAGLVRPFGEYVKTSFSYAIAKNPTAGNQNAVERFRDWIVHETQMEGLESHLIEAAEPGKPVS